MHSVNQDWKLHFLKSNPELWGDNELTHWGWVTYICMGNLTIIASDDGLSPGQRQANISTNDVINSNLCNKLQWNLKQNSNIFTQEIAFENVVWKMAAILPRPQCVKRLHCILPPAAYTHIRLSLRQCLLDTNITHIYVHINNAWPACLLSVTQIYHGMSLSWHGNTFHITGHLWGESISPVIDEFP